MGAKLKITQIGNSVGNILKKDLRSGKGDLLYATKRANEIELSPCSPEFKTQFESAEKIMRDRRNVLKKLAE